MSEKSRGRLEILFTDYDRYHQDPLNQSCHAIGIPLIAVSLLGLLARVGLSSELSFLNLGLFLWSLGSLWAIVLRPRLGLGFSIAMLGLYGIGSMLSSALLVILFLVGWIFQFVGHIVYENKSPAFLKNLEHFFVGPLWIFNKSLHLRKLAPKNFP